MFPYAKGDWPISEDFPAISRRIGKYVYKVSLRIEDARFRQ